MILILLFYKYITIKIFIEEQNFKKIWYQQFIKWNKFTRKEIPLKGTHIKIVGHVIWVFTLLLAVRSRQNDKGMES